MTYKILPTREFQRRFSRIDPTTQRRVKRKMEEVAEDPTRYKRLHYDLKDSCRVRIGTLRVLFSYDSRRQELYIETIVFDHKYR